MSARRSTPLLIAMLVASTVGCRKPDTSQNLAETETQPPVLSVSPGDFWNYSVERSVPAGILHDDSPAKSDIQTLRREYLGKIHFEGRQEPVEAFQVTGTGGIPTVQELVEIFPDRIMSLGYFRPDSGMPAPVWNPQPIPFFVASASQGQIIGNFQTPGGKSGRQLKVIAHETVSVPAGDYPAVLLLLNDNEITGIEVLTKTWFAPGVGIVKEEKSRFIKGKLVTREITSLVSTSL
ncbi:MAG: TapB family protein [Luteolibacter sp.]